MAEPLRTRRQSSTAWLNAAAASAVFVFGIVMALLGAILPMLAEQLNFDLARAGNLFLAMNFAVMVTMLGIGPLMDRSGKKPAMVAGAAVVALSLFWIARASTYERLLEGVFFLGVGGASLNAASNMLIADLYPDSRQKNSALNLLGVFFGIGGAFLPFVVGSLLRTLGLTNILLIAMMLTIGALVLFVAISFPRAVQGERFRVRKAAHVLRNPLVLLLGFVLFFQSGSEFIIAGYTSTYLGRYLDAPISTASYLLALYWGCIVLGRVASSRLLLTVRAATLVRASALGAACGALLLIFSSSTAVAALALAIIGLSFASIFPTVLGQAAGSFDSYLGTVLGVLFAISLVGGMTMPWAVGQIAEVQGLKFGLSLVAVSFVMIFGLELIISRRARSN
ncbi:MAG TPA: MFS transporter [Blastocatellia bacterium]|nr:MFS transporter [Blastocatellia bacterium]